MSTFFYTDSENNPSIRIAITVDGSSSCAMDDGLLGDSDDTLESRLHATPFRIKQSFSSIPAINLPPLSFERQDRVILKGINESNMDAGISNNYVTSNSGVECQLEISANDEPPQKRKRSEALSTGNDEFSNDESEHNTESPIIGTDNDISKEVVVGSSYTSISFANSTEIDMDINNNQNQDTHLQTSLVESESAQVSIDGSFGTDTIAHMIMIDHDHTTHISPHASTNEVFETGMENELINTNSVGAIDMDFDNNSIENNESEDSCHIHKNDESFEIASITANFSATQSAALTFVSTTFPNETVIGNFSEPSAVEVCCCFCKNSENSSAVHITKFSPIQWCCVESTLYVINTLTPHFPPDESYVESTSSTTQNTGPKRNVPKQAINSESNFRPSLSASPIPCSSVQSISTFRLLACLDKLENMAIEMGLKLARIYPKNSIDNSTVTLAFYADANAIETGSKLLVIRERSSNSSVSIAEYLDGISFNKEHWTINDKSLFLAGVRGRCTQLFASKKRGPLKRPSRHKNSNSSG